MIIVAGDVHTNFWAINGLINKDPTINMILQVGDLGWWPRCTYSFWKRNKFELGNVKMFFCEGNHDDLEILMGFDDCTEVCPNVFYMPRGSILQLPDERKVLFMGGAFSPDRKSPDRGHRNRNFGWFEEEIITQKDIYDLPDEKVDIVISHTAPESFKGINTHGGFGKIEDPSRKALDTVLEKYKPELWYFGHMHNFSQGTTSGCHWTGLSGIAVKLLPGRWWIPLEEVY